jgi:hypothetical protein
MSQDDMLRKFCEMFEAYPTQSDRKFHKRTVLNWSDYNNPQVNYHTEIVSAIAIHIPEHRVKDFLNIVDEQKYKEMQIRDNVPAVKKAYEQYKLLLKLCGGEFDARY